MWGTILSDPLAIIALVGRYPANQLMARMTIPRRQNFTPATMRWREAMGY